MNKKFLERMISDWQIIGHPALMERFVVRNGKEYEPRACEYRRGERGECFRNATMLVLERPDLLYVEGYTFIRDMPIPIHHAWVTTGLDAVDPTIPDWQNHAYVGVAFDTDVVRRTTLKQGYFGLLDSGMGLNVDFMCSIDEELRTIVDDVRSTHLGRRQA